MGEAFLLFKIIFGFFYSNSNQLFYDNNVLRVYEFCSVDHCPTGDTISFFSVHDNSFGQKEQNKKQKNCPIAEYVKTFIADI